MSEVMTRGPGRPRRVAEIVPPPPPPVFDTSPVRSFVKRLTQADLPAYAWLLPMLQEDFNGPSMETLARWTRSWESDNQFSFVGTPNAAGVAMLMPLPLRPGLIVQELFMLVRDGSHKLEGVEIYKHWAAWMKTARADRFQFHDCLGAPMAEIKAVFPRLLYQKMWYVEDL